MFESEHMCFQNYGQIPNSDLHPAVKKKKMMPIPLFQKKVKERKKEIE